MTIQPVILCGGSGTRLWPLSRYQYPKQLLTLEGEQSMLQATAKRLLPSELAELDVEAPLVIANEEYRFISAEQLRHAGMSAQALILEPFGRNTAPALTLAALHATMRGVDPVMVVMPADHIMGDVELFRVAVRQGYAEASRGKFVTFGIKPTQPHTGYGYIHVKEEAEGSAAPLRAFVEKPDAARAREYVASGEYFWNSGIFMMRASSWLAEISRVRPLIAKACEAACAKAKTDSDFFRLDPDAFATCPSESIDYAVMEGLGSDQNGGETRAVVIPLEAGWSDIGAWGALWEVGAKDHAGNVVRGDAHLVNTTDSLIFSNDRLVACVGLEDTVVVDTPDALLVAHRSRMDQVKDVVTWLKAKQRPEAEAHRKVYRPWGWYDSIDSGPRFQVKRLVVNPGASLSLQMHHHRAEHWIVVTGTAQVTRDDETFVISENQSTYIPLGARHRLVNPGKVPLEIIEVQSGAYLGEDDIVRFEDTYGRLPAADVKTNS